MVIGIKRRGKRKVQIRRRHATFVIRKVTGRRTASLDKSDLKNKWQTVEADIAVGVSDTYMLTTSIDNTSTDKG